MRSSGFRSQVGRRHAGGVQQLAAVPGPEVQRAALAQDADRVGVGTCWRPTARRWPHGSSLSTSIPEVAGAIVGTLGAIPADQATTYAEEGYPVNAKVGVDGLEEDFERTLTGRLGGELLAGTRVLARARPGHGTTVRTTIDPPARADCDQRAGRQLRRHHRDESAHGRDRGGRRNRVHGPSAARIDLQDRHRDGALAAGIATPSTQYPYESSVVLDGFTMQNAGGETCGGSLDERLRELVRHDVRSAWRSSLARTRLVAMARSSASTTRPGITTRSPARSRQPPTIGGPLAVGASAIGQGRVQAEHAGDGRCGGDDR